MWMVCAAGVKIQRKLRFIGVRMRDLNIQASNIILLSSNKFKHIHFTASFVKDFV